MKDSDRRGRVEAPEVIFAGRLAGPFVGPFVGVVDAVGIEPGRMIIRASSAANQLLFIGCKMN